MSAGAVTTVLRDGIPCSVLRQQEEWGIQTYDLVFPPRRFWPDHDSPPFVEHGVDANRVTPARLPSELLRQLPPGDSWSAQSRRSIARLFAHFLICEDPQRRLDARKVVTLSHQVSLVRHIIESEHLRRVLIADEVGLGKTVEAGLLLKELFEQNSALRVLYLAPARLVANVGREFDRLDLGFRLWKSGFADARLSDPRIVASIHRAVHGDNFDAFTDTPSWDVIVVDECHHLSDWSAGGGDPVRALRLVRELVTRQQPDGRLILMSGTPHQGHINRFDNLVELLKRSGESNSALAGRVIYRTKEDVRDWSGNPLFPLRQVNEPLVVDLGEEYRAWMRSIHEFYRPTLASVGGRAAKQRAAGWRCAQALQWAASSPQAGLGYLVRQAIRAGWSLRDGVLADALAALRPYRNGTVNETMESLFARICREVSRQGEDHDVEDIEDAQEVEGKHSSVEQRRQLNTLLQEGLQVLARFGDAKWRLLRDKVLTAAAGEKVVLFAQPIETVCSLAEWLERTTGRKPAIIIGGQTDEERSEQQEVFWRPDGPQFLVSSRAGGEGINLQVARRLVHLDVPWNPMELEQRVGRVHRFGSKETIIVDTMVVQDSREAHAYRVAREKLKLIASTMVSRERFEAIFSRVMSLVSPEELQNVLMRESASPLRREDQEHIAAMVEAGFESWRGFHERYAGQLRAIRDQDPGLARWDDIHEFVTSYGSAEPVNGIVATRFHAATGSIGTHDEEIRGVRLDGATYYVGDHSGAVISAESGTRPIQLGLNVPAVASALREHGLPGMHTGAAHLRWPEKIPRPAWWTGSRFGALIFLRQVLRSDQRITWSEQATALHCYIVGKDGNARLLSGEDKMTLIRGVLKAGVRTKPEDDASFLGLLSDRERALMTELRRPSEEEIRGGLRYAVTPLLAATVSG